MPFKWGKNCDYALTRHTDTSYPCGILVRLFLISARKKAAVSIRITRLAATINLSHRNLVLAPPWLIKHSLWLFFLVNFPQFLLRTVLILQTVSPHKDFISNHIFWLPTFQVTELLFQLLWGLCSLLSTLISASRYRHSFHGNYISRSTGGYTLDTRRVWG